MPRREYIALRGLGRWLGMRLFALLFVCLVWGVAMPACRASQPLLDQIQVYRDSSRQLGIDEIEALDTGAWRTPPVNLNFGTGRDIIWLRLELGAPLPEDPQLWLQRSNMEHVCLWQRTVDGWSEHCEGTREPLAQSHFLSPDLVFRLQPAPDRYYLKIDTANIVFLPLRLESGRGFQHAIQLKQVVDMLILGALLATLLFNLLLFIRLQKPAYLYYVLFIITASAFFFGFLFGYNRLLPQDWHDALYGVAYPLSMLSTWFLLESMLGFIPFHSEDRPSYRILRTLQVLLLFLLLLTMTASKGVIVVALLTKTYLVPLVVMGLLIRSVRRGNRIARLYLMAWVLMTVSGFALALMYQGLLPYFPVSTHLVFAAYVVSILLFSLVLAEQLHLANLEKAQLLLNHNQQLEARVLQRTSELQHSLETVDALNRSKTRLFTILAHDLRSPFASLKLMLVMLDRDTLDMSHLHMLIPRLRRQIDGIYASLENMLEWARIEMGGIKGEPELLDLSGLLNEIEAMYAAAAHQKQIAFELVPSATLEIRANRHQLHLVLRNLVNNAVKFTPAKGRVSLSAWEQDGGLRVRVQDTGIGMSPVQVADLFGTQPGQAVRHTELIRNGTEGERGIGLGLQLCKTYLEGMNARLVIDSEPGRGSVFELHFAKSEQPETHSLSLDPVTAAEAE